MHRIHGVRAQRTRRTLAARIATAVLASVIALGAVPSPAVAAPESPSPSPTSAVAAEPTIALTPLNRGLVARGETLTATVGVTNETADDLVAAELSVQIGSAPLEGRSALEAWQRTGVARATFDTIDSRVVTAIERGQTQSTTVSLSPDDPVLADKQPGVYPLVATYDGSVTVRSVVTVYDPAAVSAAPLAVLVPITTGARSTGLLSTDELAIATGPEGSLSELLDGVAGSTAILAIDPAIVASIRVLGDAAPPSALAWLDRLEALPNDRFALQFGDADVSAQVRADLSSPLAPLSLEYAVSPDGFVPPTPSPTPTPTNGPASNGPASTGGDESDEGADDGQPDEPVAAPPIDELLAVTGGRTDTYWPADGLDASILGGLAEWPGAEPITFASSAWTSDDPGRFSLAARATDAGRVLVYDAAASDAASALASAADDRALATAVPFFTAALTLGRTDAGPFLVTTGRMTDPSAAGIRAALATTVATPGYESVTLDELAAADPAPLAFDATADEAIEQRAAALTVMLDDERDVSAFATVLDDPRLLTGPQRTSILQLIGAAWAPRLDDWSAALETQSDRTEATLESVQIQPPTTVLLTTPDSGLPFYIRNDLPWPVNVTLLASPDDLRLDIERTTTWTAAPGVNTRVEVPVKARVGSGDVSVELRLISPTTVAIGPVRTLDVVVRADWERIGLTALGVIVGVLLLFGFVRTIRRRRQAAADG